MRRVEGSAEKARAGHASSNVSSPTSISAPRRAPAARSASSSSDVVRRRPRDTEAAVGAEDAEGALASRAGPVDEEVGELLGLGSRRLVRLRNQVEERAPELRDALAGDGRDGEDAGDPLVVRRRRRAAAGGRSCSARRSEEAGRGPRRTVRARRRSRGRLAATSSVTSITWTSRRARSRCARNSCPRPTPSLAPSISPGTSATVSWRPSGESTVPSTGASVVNG